MLDCMDPLLDHGQVRMHKCIRATILPNSALFALAMSPQTSDADDNSVVPNLDMHVVIPSLVFRGGGDTWCFLVGSSPFRYPRKPLIGQTRGPLRI